MKNSDRFKLKYNQEGELITLTSNLPKPLQEKRLFCMISSITSCSKKEVLKKMNKLNNGHFYKIINVSQGKSGNCEFTLKATPRY